MAGSASGSRPYSAQRLGTAAMRPPGTASLRSARPGTGVQSWARPSNPFVQQVSDRPVTQQGMAGPKTASGTGRQVADKTFYISQLRQKRSELVEVTNQLQARTDTDCVGACLQIESRTSLSSDPFDLLQGADRTRLFKSGHGQKAAA